MIRLLVSAVLFFAAAALGLFVADLALDDMSISNAGAFLTAAVLFAVLQAILAPFFLKMTRRYASALLGAVGLIATLVALVVTTLINDGLTISGVATWVLAALIVWLVSMIAAWLLPLIFVKRAVQERRSA